MRKLKKFCVSIFFKWSGWHDFESQYRKFDGFLSTFICCKIMLSFEKKNNFKDLKAVHPRPLFNLFSSFQTQITNFTTNGYVNKCPSSIWCWDSNSQPLEHEFPPVTTKPGNNLVFRQWSQNCFCKVICTHNLVIRNYSYILSF